MDIRGAYIKQPQHVLVPGYAGVLVGGIHGVNTPITHLDVVFIRPCRVFLLIRVLSIFQHLDVVEPRPSSSFCPVRGLYGRGRQILPIHLLRGFKQVDEHRNQRALCQVEYHVVPMGAWFPGHGPDSQQGNGHK